MEEIDAMSEMRLIALIHDGDCADCSCTHLTVPANLDIEAERTAHNTAWHNDKSVSVSFADWLVSKGASYETSIEEIEAF
jgi:hypothetical protein